MKLAFAVLAMVFSLFMTVVVFADETNKMNLQAGDEIHVCGCGCDCGTMAKKPGNCGCGKPMVKGTVTEVGEGTAKIKTDKEERSFSTVGKYHCACGAGCDCGTISQKPGNCGCGKPMEMAVDAK